MFWAPIDKFLTFVMNSNSRFNEFAADKFANDLGMGEHLMSGLVKITIENLAASTMLPDPLYSTYHFSHPPLIERLRAIIAATSGNTAAGKTISSSNKKMN